MSDAEHPTNRRRFLTSVAGTTAAIAAAGLSARELFAQRTYPEYPPPQDGWDLSWVNRVTKAKHRQAFDAADVGDGLVLTNALVYLQDYADVFRTTDADMGVVIVVRHRAMPLVLNDALWARARYGEKYTLKDPTTGETAARNPYANLKSDDKFAALLGDGGLDALIKRGVTVLCCNLALMRVAGEFAKVTGIPVESARAQFIDGLVPGVIRQPSGIFAIAHAQEAGCHFIKST